MPSGLVPPPPLKSLFENDQKRDDGSFCSITSEDQAEISCARNQNGSMAQHHASLFASIPTQQKAISSEKKISDSLQKEQYVRIPEPPPPPPPAPFIKTEPMKEKNDSHIAGHKQTRLLHSESQNTGSQRVSKNLGILAPPLPPLSTIENKKAPPPPACHTSASCFSGSSRGQLLDSIRNSGMKSLKKTKKIPDLDPKLVSAESRSTKTAQRSYNQKENGSAFQAEIMSKKLSPAKEGKLSHQIPKEPAKPTFESQLFDKIKKRAQLIENQMGVKEDNQKQTALQGNSSHNIEVKLLKECIGSGYNSTTTDISTEASRERTIEFSKCNDSDNFSLNSSKLSVLGNLSDSNIRSFA